MNHGMISHKGTSARKGQEDLAKMVVNGASQMHVETGPRLLESVSSSITDKTPLFLRVSDALKPHFNTSHSKARKDREELGNHKG